MHELENNLKEPLVSIGLGVRNGGEYLREALDSLLAQTHTNFELIISDNDSTDDTQIICGEYARGDSRIRYIRQKKDIGSGGNFDFVRRESRGDYFLYACHDDLWDRRFLEKCLAAFREVPDASMVFPNFYTFDDSGVVILHPPQKYFPFARDLYGRLKSYILLNNKHGKVVMFCGLWKRSVLTDLVSENEEYSDLSYSFKNLFTGCFVHVPEALFFKRTEVVSLPQNTHGSRAKKQRPSLHFLTSLPPNYAYQSTDEWYEIRKKIDKNRDWKTRAKGYIGDRLQNGRYFYLHSQYIFRSPALPPGEKAKLFLWNFYAYLRTLRDGHM